MHASEMSIPELILALRGYGLKLSTRRKKLVVRGDRQALSPELLRELKNRKAALVEAVGQLKRGAVLFRVKHPKAPRQTTALM